MFFDDELRLYYPTRSNYVPLQQTYDNYYMLYDDSNHHRGSMHAMNGLVTPSNDYRDCTLYDNVFRHDCRSNLMHGSNVVQRVYAQHRIECS
jgi:hypothetical protein